MLFLGIIGGILAYGPGVCNWAHGGGACLRIGPFSGRAIDRKKESI